jgi:hypothetical protein
VKLLCISLTGVRICLYMFLAYDSGDPGWPTRCVMKAIPGNCCFVTPVMYKVCPESNETDFLWPSRRVGERSLRAFWLVGDVRSTVRASSVASLFVLKLVSHFRYHHVLLPIIVFLAQWECNLNNICFTHKPVTHLFFIMEKLISQIGQDTNCIEMFSWFYLVLLGK